MAKRHQYRTTVKWDGAGDTGTSSYAAYGRNYRVLVDGKADLDASADPAFRGDAALHNPEDLFVAALSACHMLTCQVAGFFRRRRDHRRRRRGACERLLGQSRVAGRDILQQTTAVPLTETMSIPFPFPSTS
jgi:hypothetical protein